MLERLEQLLERLIAFCIIQWPINLRSLLQIAGLPQLRDRGHQDRARDRLSPGQVGSHHHGRLQGGRVRRRIRLWLLNTNKLLPEGFHLLLGALKRNVYLSIRFLTKKQSIRIFEFFEILTSSSWFFSAENKPRLIFLEKSQIFANKQNDLFFILALYHFTRLAEHFNWYFYVICGWWSGKAWLVPILQAVGLALGCLSFFPPELQQLSRSCRS